MSDRVGRSGKTRQHGAVAVEFALVFPLFIGIVGLSITAGLALLYRYQLLNVANNSARYCANQVPLPNNMQNCVKNYLSGLQNNVLCSNVKVTPSINDGPKLNPRAKILEVEISCDAPWVMVGALMGTGAPKDLKVKVMSAMPFFM